MARGNVDIKNFLVLDDTLILFRGWKGKHYLLDLDKFIL